MDSQYMIHPKKWRETCDPFSLNYNIVQVKEILGYPHAGNDVFYVRGVVEDKETTAYIKVARQQGAAIENEVNILAQLNESIFPKVIDYDREQALFLVTTDMSGLRLSTIVGDNEDMASLSYMEEYGEALSKIHRLRVTANKQADRRFYHCPANEVLESLKLPYLIGYFDNEPKHEEYVFCHGDFHYANLLWKNHHINAILDFELAGYGNRDFDIAWALFLRPGQKFLKTDEEWALFLKGYQKYGDCNVEAVKYYVAQCYTYFLCMCYDDQEYCEFIRNWLERNCR